MRELKFRFWNPIAKTYSMSWRYNLTHDGKILGYDVDMMDYDEPTELKDSILTIEQYTGLKDKNGVEIYEGDIVKYARSRVESVEGPSKVFTGKLIELGEDIGEIGFMGFEFVVSFDHKRYDDIEKLGNYPHRFEVIGNIHQNRELLK